MKFEQPREFLDLCERLKTTPPDFELAKEIIPAELFSGRNYLDIFCGHAFEFLVQHTAIQLAKDYGAQPLQKVDEHLLAPYTLNTKALDAGHYFLFLDKKQVAELDLILKFGEDQIWVFEAKSGWESTRMNFLLSETHLRAFTDISQKGTKISYALIMPKDKSIIRSENPVALKEIADYNIVATYLPITYEQLEDFTKNFVICVEPQSVSAQAETF